LADILIPDLDDSAVHQPEARARARGISFNELAMEIPTRMAHAAEMPLTLVPGRELLDHAAQLSVTLRHPLYDCHHLAPARRLSASLATFDKGLAELARQDGRLRELT
jgi:predicted nucleic acid-binding protein